MLESIQPLSPIPPLEEIAKRLNGPISDTPPDIIPGLLPKHGQLVIAGETNIGKSLIALEICSSLMTGTPLWGGLTPVSPAKKVLYILGEHYAEIIQRLLRVTKLPMPDNGFILGPEQLGYDKWLVQNGKPNIQGISKFQKWAEGIDLLVWDPLASFLIGSGETENDNITMRLVLDTMSLISQKAGSSCLVLAHQGKPSIDKMGNEHTRTKYAIRGASAIEDAATNIFYLGRAESNSSAAHQSSSKVLSLVCRKYKGHAPDEYKLLRSSETLTHCLLDNDKAFVDVRRIETLSKIARLQAAFPGMAYNDVIRGISAIQDMSETTVRRYLGLVK